MQLTNRDDDDIFWCNVTSERYDMRYPYQTSGLGRYQAPPQPQRSHPQHTSLGTHSSHSAYYSLVGPSSTQHHTSLITHLTRAAPAGKHATSPPPQTPTAPPATL